MLKGWVLCARATVTGWRLIALCLLGCVVLGGCGSVGAPREVAGTAISLRGLARGGQQPLSHAAIGLYAAGTVGPGSAATSLLTQPVFTDSSGDFELNGLYQCPMPNAQILLTAQGGNPGLTSATNNTGIAMMAALGPCSGLANVFVTLNEETTVAAVWALAPFMSSMADVGSTAGDPLFADAVLQAQQMVDLAAGTAPGSAPATGYVVQVNKVNHMADVLASCINSSGGVAGDGSSCGALFQVATPAAGQASTDTVAAALNVARNPTRGVVALFDCITPSAPFQPVLAAAPADWTLGLSPVPAEPALSPGTGSYSTAQSVTMTDATAGAVVRYTLDGTTPSLGSPVYTGAIPITGTTVVMAAAFLGGMQSVSAQASLSVNAAPARLAFAQQPAGGVAGAWLTPALTVQVLDSSGNLSTSFGGTVTLALGGGGSGVLSGVTTQTAVGGVAIFPHLSVSSAGSYTLVAASAGLTSATSAGFAVAAGSTGGEQATSALAFTDTVGLNLHLSYGGTLYANFPLVMSSLQDLGVHHVRDGLIDFGSGSNYYYTEYQQLAAQGIRGDYITSIGQSEALMKAYPARVGGMEALEAPNEYDSSGDVHWATALAAFLPVLHDAVHGASPMAGVTLLGPSLVNSNWTSATANSYALLGAVSGMFDEGNLHNYPGGRNPGTAGWTPQGYGSIAFAISAARQTWPSVPLVTTETGYWDDAGANESVPDAVIGRYAPRVLLEQYMAGIRRTYLYELADNPYAGGSYGLLKADGTKKPAYLALQGLMHLLADAGSGYAPGTMAWSMTGNGTDLHHLLVQKRDGTFLLALWVEEPAYDVNALTPLTVPAQAAVLHWPTPVNLVGVHRWQGDGTVSDTALGTSVSTFSVSLSDLLTVIEIHP